MKNKSLITSKLFQLFILAITYTTINAQSAETLNSEEDHPSTSVLSSISSSKNDSDNDPENQFTSEYEKMQEEKEMLHQLDKESEEKSHNRLTRDLIIIKTPSQCWNPSSFSIFNPRPDNRPGFNQSDLILQTSQGEMEDFELGEIWSRRYRRFIDSIQSPSRIYAFAANTSCHYNSIYNNLAGMFLGVKNKEVYSDSYETLVIPPGGKHNHYLNINNYALYHGFYPVAIKTDHSDHLYQIRTCERLKITIDHSSHFPMAKYKKNKFLAEALTQVYENNDHLAQLYTKEEFKFENIEYIYEGKTTSKSFDFIIGADGAGSIVRRTMDKELESFTSSSEFLSHGYKELEIPKHGNSHAIDKNALHIWPRQKFMIIALPNMDGSFTVTMFNPYDTEVGFNELDERQEVEAYFDTYFKDLKPLIPELQEDYNQNPVGRLGTVKCYPWHHKGKILLIGDAAHAIVPFYGQGMNASFEDVFVFDELLESYKSDDWLDFCNKFQEERKKNCDAIADLALDNFIEMQDKVDDKNFIEKRKLEMKLEQEADGYYSKYSLVTFKEDLSYEEAMNQGRRQDEILLELCSSDDYSFPENKEELDHILKYIQNKLDDK